VSDQTASAGTAPFEPHRFRSTIDHYVVNRPRYPRALLQLILKRLRLKAGARVLDLGCGPGFLAIGRERATCCPLSPAGRGLG